MSVVRLGRNGRNGCRSRPRPCLSAWPPFLAAHDDPAIAVAACPPSPANPHPKRKIRIPLRLAPQTLLASLLLSMGAWSAPPDATDTLLQRADRIKRTDQPAFRALLVRLDADAGRMSPTQRDLLDYLHAWQLGFRGEYPQALPARSSSSARRPR